MAFISGSWASLLAPLDNLIGQRTGIEEMQMGQKGMYNQLQAVMQQQRYQGLLGQLNGLGLNNPQQYINVELQKQIYPGKVIYPDGRVGKITEQALLDKGFIYDFDSNSYMHKDTKLFISRRMIEDERWKDIEETIKASKGPNQYWLDKRVNEMRVKLI